MIFQVLDVEQDPIIQGFEPHSYDLVIAADVIHATTDVVQALRNVLKLIRPGGVLIMNEFVNCPPSAHVSFGTLEGWWKFQDPERRFLGRTLNEKGWRESLLEAGAGEFYVLPDRPSDQQHVAFVIYNNREEPSLQLASSTSFWYILPDNEGLAQEISQSFLKGKLELNTALQYKTKCKLIQKHPRLSLKWKIYLRILKCCSCLILEGRDYYTMASVKNLWKICKHFPESVNDWYG
jgi:SAM-dependent methyltransferase